jgi:hypothetical protein
MAKAINRLTDRSIKAAPVGLFHDGGGLYLQVTQASDKTRRHSWLFRFATSDAERAANPDLGKERRMGLGAYPDVSLAEARQKAAEARRMREQGTDPTIGTPLRLPKPLPPSRWQVSMNAPMHSLPTMRKVGAPPTGMIGHGPSLTVSPPCSALCPSIWSRPRMC